MSVLKMKRKDIMELIILEIRLYFLTIFLDIIFISFVSVNFDYYSKMLNKDLIDIKKIKFLFFKYTNKTKDNNNSQKVNNKHQYCNSIGKISLAIQTLNYFFLITLILLGVIDLLNNTNNIEIPKYIKYITLSYLIIITVGSWIFGIAIYLITDDVIPYIVHKSKIYKNSKLLIIQSVTTENTYFKEILRLIVLFCIVFFPLIFYLLFGFMNIPLIILLVVSCLLAPLISFSLSRLYCINRNRNG